MTITRREDVDVVLQRVALVSFLYYPEVHIYEADYSLGDDVDFCLEPLGTLDVVRREELHRLLGQAIIDPSEYRERVFATLTELVADGSSEQ